MICVWAAPPTCMSRGLHAYQGVYAHTQGLTRERHPTTDTVASKTQTTLPLAARCQRLYRGGLQCGRYTTSNRGRGAAKRGGELRHARVRHAGDTPPEGFAWRKTPTGHRSGERRGHGGHGRSAREQRQGGATTRHPARGLRQSTTQLAQQQTHQAPSVQNSPRSPLLTACAVQNSPCTPALAACAV